LVTETDFSKEVRSLFCLYYGGIDECESTLKQKDKMNTSLLFVVPINAVVYKTKRPTGFGHWELARRKRGTHGWAKLGQSIHECRWVPARNGILGHWAYINLPVDKVVDLYHEDVGPEDRDIFVLETSEGNIGAMSVGCI
jgi:hypothetical protein